MHFRLFLATPKPLLHISKRFRTPKEVSYKYQIPNHEFHNIIKWIRPEYIPHWSPIRTCDLQNFPTIDPRWIRLEYRPFAHIIDKLPEEKRKLFTVEFGRRKDGSELVIKDTLRLVQRHLYDEESPEYKVTWRTMKVRNYQAMIEEHPFIVKNHTFRIAVEAMIRNRKRELDKLRGLDYKRFEWLINLLGIIYKLDPPGNTIQRKASIVKLTDLYCEAIKDRKLLEYAQELDSQKIPFLHEKLTTLQMIKGEEEAMDLESSVDEEIVETRKLLEKLEKNYVELRPLEDMENVTKVEKEADSPASILQTETRDMDPRAMIKFPQLTNKILRQKQRREPDLSLYLNDRITRKFYPNDEYNMPKCMYGKGLYPKKGKLPSKRWL